jgi:spore coat polysaccharide biosynthesis predicted glycosyltransferase SpsG
VELIDAPDSLLEPLLAADIVVSAAGQTMLEAAACGTPCVALPLAHNQREQAVRLANLGAVRLVDPPEPVTVVAAVGELAADTEAQLSLSRTSQRAVDGYGAVRVAFHIARLTEARG